MADLKYYNYPGVGEENKKNYHYSQAVRVGDTIQIAGQGGGDPDKGVISPDIQAQIDQAFANVELALKTAGGKGWEQVFSVRSYHLPLNNEALGAVVRNFRKWCPDHQPLWTCVGVQRLARDDMRVEIEVQAFDPEGAKKA
ncbi:endoribonuclease L-PSP [Xylaria flabelliformis]|nr:endoribonuclease L-PSP [Xylaria flabelliformis]KAI0854700.1 L-PSP endoribonuclease family protein [Xylaria cubensis]